MSNPNKAKEEAGKKPSVWQRATAFLFTHRWHVVDARLIEPYTPCTTLECERCGQRVEYATFNKEMFVGIYRSRGCTRHISKAEGKV